MKPNQKRAHKWAMINECIKRGVWADESAFREWMMETFNQESTSLKPTDDSLLMAWLYFHTGRTNVRPSGRPSWLSSNLQINKIKELAGMLDWNLSTLNQWIEKQLHKPFLLESLSKDQATRLITGLSKLVTYNQTKGKL